MDKRVEAVIVSRLSAAFPEYGFLCEEGSTAATPDNDNAPIRWVIDPIDGTTSFLHGHPCFSISIALQEVATGQSLVGVVYGPMMDEMFVAVKGHGATVNGKAMHVSDVPSLKHSLVSTGFTPDRRTVSAKESNLAYFNAMIMEIQGSRRNGSAALDLSYVAMGRQDAYYELKLKPWDIAAGVLLVHEAGGKVTDYDGNPVDLCAKLINVFGSNGIVHDEAVAVFKKVKESDE